MRSYRLVHPGKWANSSSDFGEFAHRVPSLTFSVPESFASDMANRMRDADQLIAALA